MKNWNFPKAHAPKHIFNDIWEKGTARNFTMRPNEGQHRPLKQAFALQTNYKEVADQILKLDHKSFVSEMIYGHILHLDDLRQQELEGSDDNTIDDEPFSGHIYLG
ncbi:hypothetical protein AZE42_13785, partial [Rhizopogon vesiculosus]